ncbi:MAG: glycosyltransferase family 4 protein [Candidatus Falkowbacteria bacterium]
MKKVLIFSTAYYPFIGGAEVAVKEITDRIKDAEFDMITARMDPKLPKFEKIGNINAHRIGIGCPKCDKYFLAFRGHKFAKKLHQKNNYNSIWSIMASYSGFSAMFFSAKGGSAFGGKKTRIPFLLTLQEGDDLEYINKRVGILKPLFKKIFTSADYIQCISNFLADWAKKMGAKCPVEVIPNGVDIKRFTCPKCHIYGRRENIDLGFKINDFRKKLNIQDDEKVIITTSRLVEKNGIKYLIDAINILISKYKLPVKLLILGDGELRNDLELQVKNLNLQNKVLFLGEIKHDELPKYLWASDVFCRPSLSEGLGNSFLEAMAAGLLVLATPVGGIPDFLENSKTGFFCEVKNPESIAEKIKYILDEKNKDEIENIKINVKKMVEKKYNWDKIAKDMNNIFNKINCKNSSRC